jgi:uncharacterized protein with GYD domain
MATYVILSRFSPEAFREPKDFTKLAEAVSSKIKSECPGVRWKDSYATLVEGISGDAVARGRRRVDVGGGAE